VKNIFYLMLSLLSVPAWARGSYCDQSCGSFYLTILLFVPFYLIGLKLNENNKELKKYKCNLSFSFFAILLFISFVVSLATLYLCSIVGINLTLKIVISVLASYISFWQIGKQLIRF
jgi:hypothetical protein